MNSQMRTAIGVTALLVLLCGQALAVEPPPSRKMTRQIEVMEKIIDQVLLDSPNFLIRGLPVARGAYIEDFGVLFTFDAALVGKGWDELKKWDLGGFKIEEKDGHKIVILPKVSYGDEDDDDGEEAEEVEEDLLNWRDERLKKQEDIFGRGKTEMVEVLLDYGDTLTSLEDGQSVAIMAFVTDEDFIDRRKLSRLILKAKVSDLRGFASGDLSEEAMVKRIVEQEY